MTPPPPPVPPARRSRIKYKGLAGLPYLLVAVAAEARVREGGKREGGPLAQPTDSGFRNDRQTGYRRPGVQSGRMGWRRGDASAAGAGGRPHPWMRWMDHGWR